MLTTDMCLVYGGAALDPARGRCCAWLCMSALMKPTAPKKFRSQYPVVLDFTKPEGAQYCGGTHRRHRRNNGKLCCIEMAEVAGSWKWNALKVPHCDNSVHPSGPAYEAVKRYASDLKVFYTDYT